MSEFYADAVHCHISENPEATLEMYRKTMRRELAWMGTEPRQLRDLTCLGVGTGYQAIILAELGCYRVFHLDPSERLLAEYRQQFAGENDGQFLGDMLDDLFVPVRKCFHPRWFRNDAEIWMLILS